MKLPAPWIAGAFATGIAFATRWPASPKLWAEAAATAIMAGGVLAWRDRLATAWAMTLLAWLATGGFASSVERTGVPANHVTRLIASGRIDSSEPLRWRGRLREDPLLQPWGRRYEIALDKWKSQACPRPSMAACERISTAIPAMLAATIIGRKGYAPEIA